jgi:transcriptional regulator with XRE-family HTH domain
LTRLTQFGPSWPMITPSQCRAARGLLDWTQQELADAARIGVATVRLFERDAAESRQATLAVLRQAFELAGVEFIDENGGGPGVRLRKRQRPKKNR